jgi:hypothetical protein
MRIANMALLERRFDGDHKSKEDLALLEKIM